MTVKRPGGPGALLLLLLVACGTHRPAADPGPEGTTRAGGATAEAHLAEAERHFRSLDLEAAAAHYRQALERDPQNARAHYRLGEIAMVEGRSDEARQHLIRVAEAGDPRSRANALMDLGIGHVYDGDLMAAKRVNREAAGIAAERRPSVSDPNQLMGLASPLRNVAVLDATMGNAAELERALEEMGVLTGRDHPILHWTAALGYAILGRLDEARGHAAAVRPAAGAQGMKLPTGQLQALSAMIAVREGDLGRAREEIAGVGEPDAVHFLNAFLAEALEEAGRQEEAAALRAVIAAETTPRLWLSGDTVQENISFWSGMARLKAGAR